MFCSLWLYCVYTHKVVQGILCPEVFTLSRSQPEEREVLSMLHSHLFTRQGCESPWHAGKESNDHLRVENTNSKNVFQFRHRAFSTKVNNILMFKTMTLSLKIYATWFKFISTVILEAIQMGLQRSYWPHW